MKNGNAELRVEVSYEEREVRSADGTRIRYFVCAGNGPTLVLAPGLATPFLVYKYIIERFSPWFRIIAWDMRGTYGSAVPRGGVDACRVEDNVADLEAIVEKESLEKFTLGGWSAGVQISLEYYHQHPEQCEGLLLINGGYGQVLETALNLPKMELITKGVTRLTKRLSFIVNPSIFFLLGRQRVIKLLGALKLYTANRPFIEAVVDQWRTLDFGFYMGMILKLNEHNGESYLRDVVVPTLVTAGGKDPMTPVSLAKYMVERISDAELLVVPKGTHYTQLEYPRVLNDAIGTFLRRVYPGLMPE